MLAERKIYSKWKKSFNYFKFYICYTWNSKIIIPVIVVKPESPAKVLSKHSEAVRVAPKSNVQIPRFNIYSVLMTNLQNNLESISVLQQNKNKNKLSFSWQDGGVRAGVGAHGRVASSSATTTLKLDPGLTSGSRKELESDA